MEQEINNAFHTLHCGGIILFPTDTVWGIGCDATNKKAVEKILKIKKRRSSKGFIVLVSDEKLLGKYVKNIPSVTQKIIRNCDKPLTVIYPVVRGLAANVKANDGSAAIRITGDEFCKKLVTRLGKPIVSTSANISGKKAPDSFGEIQIEILQQVDYIVNLRREETTSAEPSRIIKINDDGKIIVLRP